MGYELQSKQSKLSEQCGLRLHCMPFEKFVSVIQLRIIMLICSNVRLSG